MAAGFEDLHRFTMEDLAYLSGAPRSRLEAWRANGALGAPLYSSADAVRARAASMLMDARGASEAAAEALLRAMAAASNGTVRLEDEGGDAGFRLSDVAAEVERLAAPLFARRADEIGRIVRSPDVLGGAPRLAGTRVPVAAIRRYLEAGLGEEAILDDYPSLDPGDIAAVRAATNAAA